VPLRLNDYTEQVPCWPATGRHILAPYDDASVVVYQAYRPEIGRFAASHGFFGGGFSFDRMSWIKPNFLWMMYRSGWGAKPGQEVTLAVWLKREACDAILAAAVPSTYAPGIYATEQEWRDAVAHSEARVQWDPDHDPTGRPLERRALQLGLRGELLGRYAREWIVEIDDISSLVAAQSRRAPPPFVGLMTPAERVYLLPSSAVARRLGIG
jgi:hypothetical protein